MDLHDSWGTLTDQVQIGLRDGGLHGFHPKPARPCDHGQGKGPVSKEAQGFAAALDAGGFSGSRLRCRVGALDRFSLGLRLLAFVLFNGAPLLRRVGVPTPAEKSQPRETATKALIGAKPPSLSTRQKKTR